MTENQNDDRGDQGQFDEDRAEENTGGNEDIIELSDIAIGIGPEDDQIIELTEEVIVESMSGITGASSESFEKAEDILDLSEEAKTAAPETADVDIEEQISEELDTYFGTEEDVAFEETGAEDAVSSGSGEKLSGLSDKIDKIYAEVLKISNELQSLKERLESGEK